MLETNELLMNRYRVLELAGKGGMGRVYHAVDIQDGSHWAIKEDLSEDGDCVLFEESLVLKDLDHPALPKTRGTFTHEGKPYMIMQFMEGDTLAAKLKQRSQYPEQQVLSWFQQICHVLCYLHSRPRPIVYRDLKPSNIIIDARDRVKIIDFGIAEEYSRQEGGHMIKGGLTKGYAAPEQYNSRFKADVRTDIYALGVTIHYLLTGKNPIKPPYEFLPVRKLAPEVSPAMEAIVKRCLQPNPDKRYPTADALYDDLIHIDRKNRAIKARQRKLLLGACAVVATLGLCLALVTGAVKSRRQTQIDAYRSLVESSRQAADSQDYEAALALAQEAIAMEAQEMEGYLAVAYGYMQQAEYDQCRTYIRDEILERFPDCFGDTGFLGLMADLYSRTEQTEEALYYYQERCHISPDTAEYWLDLTDCQLRLGLREEAASSLESYRNAGGDPELYQTMYQRIQNS